MGIKNKYNGYGKAKRRTPGQMNATEKAYALQVLTPLLESKDILEWSYEPVNLRIAPACSYKPDFMVISRDLTVEFHEVKGAFIHDTASIVRLKSAAEKFPFKFILAQLSKKRVWEIKQIGNI
jgi:hypothetical protein